MVHTDFDDFKNVVGVIPLAILVTGFLQMGLNFLEIGF